MSFRWRAAAGVALLLHATAGWSHVDDSVDLSFDGFGTLGLVYFSEDEADFVSDPFDPEGAGATRPVSAEVDSRIGLQVRGDFTDRLSAVVQYVAEQRFDDSYEPELEWANVKYQITPDLHVRAGRMVLPTFMESGHRKVGYALPWARPPREVYQVSRVTNMDGVSIGHRARFSGITNTVEVLYGRKDFEFTSPLSGTQEEAEVRELITISETVDWRAASFHVGFTTTEITVPATDPLFDAFRDFGPEGEAIADRYSLHDKRANLLSVGAEYDPGQWFAQGEYVRFESNSFTADSRGFYVTGGYRYGSLTPYATVARVDAASKTQVEGLSLQGLSSQEERRARILNNLLNRLLSDAPQQTSVSVGARWDFAPRLAVKAQYDYIDFNDGSPGFTANRQDAFRPGQSAHVVSLTLDFVF